MNTWFYSDSQHTYGPITTEQLIAMIQAGQLVAGHFLMPNGAQEWQALGASPFAGYLPQAAPPVAAPAARLGPPVQRPAQPRHASAQHAPVPVKKKSPWVAAAAVLALAAAGGGYFWHQSTTAPAFPTATKEKPFVNSLGMQFVPVPGTDLLVCMHETRKQDFAAFAKDDPRIRDHWKNGMYQGKAVSSGDDHPVGYMSWHDADAFCDWLSKKEGRSYRLPSDHEWCSAAGIPSDPNAREAKDGKLFPVERHSDLGVTTWPVMSLKPNTFGVFDLMGNVGEWCSDIHPERLDLRVVRGGMWESFPDRSGFEQSGDGPTDHRPYSGFRCVLAPAPLPVPDWTPLKRVDGCVTYNPSNLKIMNRGADGWLLTDGTVHLQLLDKEAEANLALAMAKEHTQRCIIGRGDCDNTFEYWYGDSGLRGGAKSSEVRTCDPSEFSLEKVKDREDDSLWEFKVQFDRAGTVSCFFDSRIGQKQH